MNILRFIREKLFLLLGAGLCVVVLGEAQTRVPFFPQRLEYLSDRDVKGLLQASQAGFEWIANQSKRSPLATINSDGHRGDETDWNRPAIVALGSSEAFGMGVRDDQVWTRVLEERLHGSGLEWEVVNAAGLGFGAYHQAEVMKRIGDQRRPRGFVVSLSIAERYFESVPEESRDADYAASLRRQQVRKVSTFVPFVYTKVVAQLPSIRQALRPTLVARSVGVPIPSDASFGEEMASRDRQYWSEMIALAEELDGFILFVVRDPQAYDSSAVLVEVIEDLCDQYRRAEVVRLGPSSFGMGQLPRELRQAHYRSQLTLVIDPHANARQHEIIGSTVGQYIMSIAEAAGA